MLCLADKEKLATCIKDMLCEGEAYGYAMFWRGMDLGVKGEMNIALTSIPKSPFLDKSVSFRNWVHVGSSL